MKKTKTKIEIRQSKTEHQNKSEQLCPMECLMSLYYFCRFHFNRPMKHFKWSNERQ